MSAQKKLFQQTKKYSFLLFLVMFLTGIILAGSNVKAATQTFTENGIRYEQSEDGFVRDLDQNLSFYYNSKTKTYKLQNIYYVNNKIPQNVVIPDTIKGKKVTEIGAWAFNGKKEIKSIKIGKNITTIGVGCFNECSGLKEMTIPASVKNMEAQVFSNCKNLKKVVVKGNLKKVNTYTFWNCTKLEEIVFSGKISEIGAYSVYKCQNLSRIVVSKNVKKVDNYAFIECSDFTVVAPKWSPAYNDCYEGKMVNLTSTKALQFNIRTSLMVAGEQKQISAMNFSGKLTWKSSNKSVIKITKSGVATAVKAGTATLTATGNNQTFTFKMKVLPRTYDNVIKVITTEYVRPEMTDYEKVVETNAWLVRNIKYNYDAYLNNQVTWDDARAETVLVRGLAVCSGYADCFQTIMDYYKIPCTITTSRAMNHAWNVVQIDGKWYHVDATWNDPIITVNGKQSNTNTKVGTGYLLKSGSEIKDHYGYDYKGKTSSHSTVNRKYQTVSENSKKKITDTALQAFLNKNKVTLVKGGETFTLKLTGAKVKSFSVKNKSIATVSKKGVITAKKKGNTTITVKAANGKKYTCTVKVENPGIDKTNLNLNKGESATLKVSETSQTITWKSSDTKVATVTQQGKVTAVGGGTAKITATVKGRKLTCTITVHEHSYTTTIIKQATCEETGIKKLVCTCGKTQIKSIEAKGHSYKEEITKEAVCGDEGIKTFTCSCGDSYTETIPAPGRHSIQWVVTKEPSATTAETPEDFGSRESRCKHCGKLYQTEEIINIDGKRIYGYFDDASAALFGAEINNYRQTPQQDQTGNMVTVPALATSASLDTAAKMELVKYLATRSAESISNRFGIVLYGMGDSIKDTVWEYAVYYDEKFRREDVTTMGTAFFYENYSGYYSQCMVLLME